MFITIAVSKIAEWLWGPKDKLSPTGCQVSRHSGYISESYGCIYVYYVPVNYPTSLIFSLVGARVFDRGSIASAPFSELPNAHIFFRGHYSYCLQALGYP